MIITCISLKINYCLVHFIKVLCNDSRTFPELFEKDEFDCFQNFAPPSLQLLSDISPLPLPLLVTDVLILVFLFPGNNINMLE